MLVKKFWYTEIREYNILRTRKTWRGWFLFGFIPLYIELVKYEVY